MPEIVNPKDGATLAYRQILGKGPGIVFLGGFMSDMMGSKARYLEEKCQEWGRSFLCFDYFGHGTSSGKFEEGTIGRWLEDALFVFDELTKGPQIVVGSSMGGWLMILLALKRRERVHGLVGIAAAPDFTEDFMRLTPEQQMALEEEGVCHIPSQAGEEPFIISKVLVLEAKKHQVLQGPIAIDCPVRLLHGLNDTDVSWQKSLQLSECLTSNDVALTLVKDGTHRLCTPSNLILLSDTISTLF